MSSRLQRQDVALRVAEDARRLERLRSRLENAGSAIATVREQRVERCGSRLEALSPLRVLERGYALVYGTDGKLLRSATSVTAYDTVTARLAEGSFRARVLEKD